MDKKRKRKKLWILYLCMWVVIAALNAAAWNSTAFCDWYIAHVFPVWVGTYGRLTGLFPFSVGEWMLAAGLALVTAAVLLGIAWAAVRLCSVIQDCWKKKASGERKGERGTLGQADRYAGFERGVRRFFLFFAWTFLGVCLIMTLNCFILYHASTFSEHYFGENDREYTLEETIRLYNMVAEECNRLSQCIQRDGTGMAVYVSAKKGNDAGGEAAAMADTARMVMKSLGAEYPQLDGYYPRPKALFFSDFMCQQYMQGYYFPFSMEANYNDVMHILNIPSTMCHELAHLRGYIFEDEANFIGYLACVRSEDEFFQYAGYLSVLNYLYNDLVKARKGNPEAFEAAAERVPPAAISEQVWEDNIFVTEEEWNRINESALIDTEVVDKAADVFIDTNLKVNGVSDGKVSYSRVVRLLLQYYYAEGAKWPAGVEE